MPQIDFDKLSRELIDKGLLIEAGFVSLRKLAIPLDAPQLQVDEMRSAFFAGAQHLFASIMGALESGDEPTDNDMRRMDAIQKELDGFIRDFEARHLQTKGSA